MRLKTKKIFLVVIVFFAAIFVVGAFFVYPIARNFTTEIKQANQEFSTAVSLAKKSDWPQSAEYFQKSSASFSAAQKTWERLGFFKNIFWLGREWRLWDQLVTLGAGLNKTASEAVNFAQEFSAPFAGRNISFNDLSLEERGVLLKKINQTLPLMTGAKAEIDLSLLSLQNLPFSFSKLVLSSQLAEIKSKLDFFSRVLGEAEPLFELAPRLAGYPKAATYLLLLQNNTELRPTGGFIGTYAIIKTEAGQVQKFFVDDSYNLDKQAKKETRPPTPLPMQKYLGQKYWYFRDSNWSPDFQESAKLALQFYQEEGGQEKNIDGVIALTPDVISSILGAIGPLALNWQIFSEENLVDVLEWQVEKAYLEQGIPRAQRKDIVGVLGAQLLENLHRLPFDKWPDIIHLLNQALIEKHILFFSPDISLQNFFEEKDWAGRVSDFDGDYLMAIDANLSALKTDLVMERNLSYVVQKQGNDFVATVKINYHNQGTDINWRITRYRTYTRVYVPLGSKLISSQGAMIAEKQIKPGVVDVGKEFDKTFFGAFLAVEPGETKTLEFKYKLPATLGEKIQKGDYQLLVQKQPGVAERDLTISLNLGKNILQWQPTGLQFKGPGKTAVWQTKLRTDQLFEVNF